MGLKIWVDADACPKLVKEVLYKAAQNRQVELLLVANQPLHVPKSPYITSRQVPAGFDVADDEIADQVAAGDLVITADIPLADAVVNKQAIAINPRGTLYTAENIKGHLQRRDMLEQLRTDGLVSGGPPPFGKKDVQQFANTLDRELTRALKS